MKQIVFRELNLNGFDYSSSNDEHKRSQKYSVKTQTFILLNKKYFFLLLLKKIYKKI